MVKGFLVRAANLYRRTIGGFDFATGDFGFNVGDACFTATEIGEPMGVCCLNFLGGRPGFPT